MLPTRGYAAQAPTSKLAPFAFERREPGPKDMRYRFVIDMSTL